jgi:LCP family protein required for cell wall assembly
MVDRLGEGALACHHWPVTGSTLYRRLPNGSWAAQREDPPATPADGGAPEPEMARAGAVPVVAGAAAVGASVVVGPGSAVPGAVTADPDPASPPPTIAQPTPPPTKLRRRWPIRRIILWALAAYVAWLVVLVVYAAASLDKVEALSPDPIADTDGTVWLLVGSDSRDGLTKKEQKKLRTGDVEGQRTDTIMLVHQQLGQTPTLVSIPRDSWVTIPSHTASDGTQVEARGGKINSAFSYGGAPLLSETIEYNTGLHVDHYMEVGMGGIVDMTDAVGGIGVCFDKAISDKNSGLDVQPGCQTLDGAAALAWVRMRYADPKGDLGRIERQRQYIALMVDQMLSWQTVVNPFRQWAIVNAMLDSVRVDTGTGLLNLGTFGFGMGRIAAGSGEVTTVPIDDTDHWENGQWVIKWDAAEAGQLFSSLGASTPQSASDQ